MKSNNQINIPRPARPWTSSRWKLPGSRRGPEAGYNGHLTSREAGSVGGQMVKKMIEAYERSL